MAKVLLVEDEDSLRNQYVFVLTHAGHAVQACANADEAAMALKSFQPDVMLLDMLMPGMSGIEFLQREHPKERYPNLKIVALSNLDSASIKDEAAGAGIDEYYIKVELVPKDLVALVARLTGPAPHVAV